MLRRALVALALACSCFSISAEMKEPEHDCQTRPAWCQSGFSCAPISCLVELRTQLEEARIDLRTLQRDSRRLHFDLTCGFGVATVADQAWDVKASPTPGACIYGVAIRLNLPRFLRGRPP